MSTRNFVGVGIAVVVGILIGAGLVYALLRPAPSTAAGDAGLDTGIEARGAGFGGGGAAMNFRGDYDSGVGYLTGDVVTFKGAAYVAGDETKDSPPDAPWALLVDAQQGPEGPAGPKGDPGARGSPGPQGPAGGLTGYVLRTKNARIAAGANTYVTADCPAGHVALGGGYRAYGPLTSQADQPIELDSDLPTAWYVWFGNPTQAPVDVVLTVICANAP